MILVCLLVFFGLTLVISSMATAYWLANLSCTMIATGCQSASGELFIGMMFSLVGIVFWATLALGVFILWWGFRVKSHHLRKY